MIMLQRKQMFGSFNTPFDRLTLPLLYTTTHILPKGGEAITWLNGDLVLYSIDMPSKVKKLHPDMKHNTD